jgi:hypothetical protein
MIFEEDLTMKTKKLITLLLLLPLTSSFYGCATTESKTSSPSEGSSTNSNVSSKTEKKAAGEDNSKAARKISQAIGEETSDFTIASQQQLEAPAGYDGTQYTVKTKAGKTYKCEILEPSGFGKAISWGMASGAGAMCTDFTKAGPTKKPPPVSRRGLFWICYGRRSKTASIFSQLTSRP